MKKIAYFLADEENNARLVKWFMMVGIAAAAVMSVTMVAAFAGVFKG